MTTIVPPVERIYVAACTRDLHLTRLCLASIRYRHPDIPVSLVIDEQLGPCDTRRLERDWNVERFQSPVRRFDAGFSKLETLFLPRRERHLMLDSDIVLLGPILDLLNATAGDFVVHPEVKTPRDLERATFAVKPLAEFDPGFIVPARVFNSGQYVATSGILRREDFDRVLEWTEPRRSRHPEIFKLGDQGMMNYVLGKAEQAGRLSLTWQPIFLCRFIYWKRDNSAAEWSRRWRRLRRKLHHWVAGQPPVAGGPMDEIPPSQLDRFYEIEKAAGMAWRWSEPDAAIHLAVNRGDYQVRIETGSPLPMADLAEKHLRFFIGERPLSPQCIQITGGTADIHLRKEDFPQDGKTTLRFTLDRVNAPQDDRQLGMPVSAFWVTRRKHRDVSPQP